LGQELKVEDKKLFTEELRFFKIYYLKRSNISVARRRKWNIAKTLGIHLLDYMVSHPSKDSLRI
jgi:hypothetical protein